MCTWMKINCCFHPNTKLSTISWERSRTNLFFFFEQNLLIFMQKCCQFYFYLLIIWNGSGVDQSRTKFSRCFLHTSLLLVLCYGLKHVVWMGILLTDICLIFMLLNNQEMLYSQANQKMFLIYNYILFPVSDYIIYIPYWHISVHNRCHWLVNFNKLIKIMAECVNQPNSAKLQK